MKVNKTFEMENGSARIDAEFDAEELNFIVEVGLATLLTQGAYPFVNQDTIDKGNCVGVVGNA